MTDAVATIIISTAGATIVSLTGMWISAKHLGKRIDALCKRIDDLERRIDRLEARVSAFQEVVSSKLLDISSKLRRAA